MCKGKLIVEDFYRLDDYNYDELKNIIINQEKIKINYEWLINLSEEGKQNLGINKATLEPLEKLYEGLEQKKLQSLELISLLIHMYFPKAKDFQLQFDEEDILEQEVKIWLED